MIALFFTQIDNLFKSLRTQHRKEIKMVKKRKQTDLERMARMKAKAGSKSIKAEDKVGELN